VSPETCWAIKKH